MKLLYKFERLTTFISIGLLYVYAAIIALPAHADVQYCGNAEVGTPGFNSKFCAGTGNPMYLLINGVANYITGIIGAVAVLIIIISGIQMITSAGQPEAIKAGKKRLTTAILSLFLLISMRLILNLIVKDGNY